MPGEDRSAVAPTAGHRDPSAPVDDPVAVLARCDELAAAGRTVEALDLAAAAERRRPDPRLEERLVELRVAAFAPPAAPGRSAWPPRVEDRFPGVEGPPEVAVDELTADVLSSAIVHHGSLVVRGLVPPARAAELREVADRAFEARAQASAGADPATTTPWYLPSRRGKGVHEAFGQANHVRLVDTPRGLAELTGTFVEVGVADVVADVLGERPALSTHKASMRRLPAEGPGAPSPDLDYHQDGAFLGAGIRTVNIWLALTPCGRDAASLDVVPHRIDHVVPPGTDGALFDWMLSRSTVARLAGPGGVAHLDFAAGDALLFDELLVHRTGAFEGMTAPRYATETWLFAPSSYPDEHVPLLL